MDWIQVASLVIASLCLIGVFITIIYMALENDDEL